MKMSITFFVYIYDDHDNNNILYDILNSYVEDKTKIVQEIESDIHVVLLNNRINCVWQRLTKTIPIAYYSQTTIIVQHETDFKNVKWV